MASELLRSELMISAQQVTHPEWFNAALNNNIGLLTKCYLEDESILDKKNRQGRTALMIGLEAGHVDVVELLLILGSDLEYVKNDQNKTAYEILFSDIKYLVNAHYVNIFNIVERYKLRPSARTTVTISQIKEYLQAIKLGQCFLTFKEFFRQNHLPAKLFPKSIDINHKIKGRAINSLLELGNLVEFESFIKTDALPHELYNMMLGEGQKIVADYLTPEQSTDFLKDNLHKPIRYLLLTQNKFKLKTFYSCPVFHIDLTKKTYQHLNLSGLCLGATLNDMPLDANISVSSFRSSKIEFSNLDNVVAVFLMAEGLDVVDTSFKHSNASKANFKHSNWNRVECRESEFYLAQFEVATVLNTVMDNSNLEKAQMNGAKIYNVSFRESNLRFSNFSIFRANSDKIGSVLKNVDVCKADISYGTFYRAEIDALLNVGHPATKFINTNFIGVQWKDELRDEVQKHHPKAIISFEQLLLRLKTGEDLSHINLSHLNLTVDCIATDEKYFPNKSRLSKAFFNFSNLSDSSLEDCDLLGADFEGANLKKLNFSWSILENCNFVRSRLDHTNFRNANLRDSNFRESTILNIVYFEDADLSNVDLRGVKMEDNKFIFPQIEEFSKAKSLRNTIMPQFVEKHLESKIRQSGKKSKEFRVLKKLLQAKACLNLSNQFKLDYTISTNSDDRISKAIKLQNQRHSGQLSLRLHDINLNYPLTWTVPKGKNTLGFIRIERVQILEYLGGLDKFKLFIQQTKTSKDYRMALHGEILKDLADCSIVVENNYEVYCTKELYDNKRLTPLSAYLFAQYNNKLLCIWVSHEQNLQLEYMTPGAIRDLSAITHLVYDSQTLGWVQIDMPRESTFHDEHLDYFRKFEWFMNQMRQACLGECSAQYDMAKIYHTGTFENICFFSNTNRSLAAQWFKNVICYADDAAKLTPYYRDSQFRLGHIILERLLSKQVTISDQEKRQMVIWLRLAADAGYGYACYDLVYYYAHFSKTRPLDQYEIQDLSKYHNQLRVNADFFQDPAFRQSVQCVLIETEFALSVRRCPH